METSAKPFIGTLLCGFLCEKSSHSGITQHRDLCSSEIQESGKIAKDGSGLLPVIRDRVNHSVTVMDKYMFLSSSLSKPNCSLWKTHGFCTWIHKKCMPWSGDQKFALPPPYPGTTIFTNNFTSAPVFSSSIASFCYLRDDQASKAEWTVPSSIIRWSEHPVDMGRILAHRTPALPLPRKVFNHFCSWRWYFHQHMMASVASPMWIQREKIIWCLNPREGFRPQS